MNDSLYLGRSKRNTGVELGESNDLKSLRDIILKRIISYEQVLDSRIGINSPDTVFKISNISNRILFDQRSDILGGPRYVLIDLYEQDIQYFWYSLCRCLLKQLSIQEVRIIESMTKINIPRNGAGKSIKIDIDMRYKIFNILQEKIGDPFDLLEPLSQERTH